MEQFKNHVLTKQERLSLANQFRILATTQESESNLVKAEILERGFTGQYHHVFDFEEEYSQEVCNETEEILQMYRVLNNAYNVLNPDEKETIEFDRVSFRGFDGNHDNHYHYMNFLVQNMNLWQEYEGQNLNSHTGATIRQYRAMLAVYDRVYGAPNWTLTADNIREIVASV